MLVLTSSFSTVSKKLCASGTIVFGGKRVAFIPTASDPYKDKSYVIKDRRSLVKLGCDVFDVDLKNKKEEALMLALESADTIFVAGGNVLYLADQMHKSGFTKMIRSLLIQRTYIGSSAGSILLGPSVRPFFEEDRGDLPKDFVLSDDRGLMLVDYVVLPHTNNQTYLEVDQKILKGFADKFHFVKLKDDEFLVEDVPATHKQ